MKLKLLMRMAVLTVVFLLTCSVGAMAQGPEPPPSCGGDTGEPCSDVPLDGGLAFLLAAGVGYGVKKVKDSHRQENIS